MVGVGVSDPIWIFVPLHNSDWASISVYKPGPKPRPAQARPTQWAWAGLAILAGPSPGF